VPSAVKRLVGWGMAIVSLIIIVVGLLPVSEEADPDQRRLELSQRIACPWCDGQSLAESDSQVGLRERYEDEIRQLQGDDEADDSPEVISGKWLLGIGGAVIWRRQRT